MGQVSAPGAFQHLVELVFAGFSYEMALVHLDDVMVLGRNFDEHLKRLELAFKRLTENGVKIKGSKCNFLPKACQLLDAHCIREWRQVRPRESKSGRKNERTIIPEGCQGLSRPCGLLSEPCSGSRKNSRTSLHFTE